jgi:hypothetical protein
MKTKASELAKYNMLIDSETVQEVRWVKGGSLQMIIYSSMDMEMPIIT